MTFGYNRQKRKARSCPDFHRRPCGSSESTGLTKTETTCCFTATERTRLPFHYNLHECYGTLQKEENAAGLEMHAPIHLRHHITMRQGTNLHAPQNGVKAGSEIKVCLCAGDKFPSKLASELLLCRHFDRDLDKFGKTLSASDHRPFR